MSSKRNKKRTGSAKETAKTAKKYEELNVRKQKQSNTTPDKEWVELTSRGSLAWRKTLISAPKMARQFLEAGPADLQEHLAELLDLDDIHVNIVDAALLDIYTNVIWRAKEAQLNVLQTSAFFSLVADLINNIKEKQMTLEENVDYFKQAMQKRSTLNPWDGVSSIPDFDGRALPIVTDHIKLTVFQHYQLYSHVFARPYSPEVEPLKLTYKTPLQPPPLMEGVPVSELYTANGHAAPSPPTVPGAPIDENSPSPSSPKAQQGFAPSNPPLTEAHEEEEGQNEGSGGSRGGDGKEGNQETG